jgi:hypothetical protein
MQDEQKEGGFVMLVFLAVAILTPSIAALAITIYGVRK